ncbi:MAG: GlcNAc-PI de-N-acetylase [Bellilinea sp.]|nr:MAG: GlcNAc-PI de-N-acetylase [Bellilinea sp.]
MIQLEGMNWVFLSPHLDDAVLSCGGLIYELIQNGEQVEICTVCAGDPPPGKLSPLAKMLHQRWGVTARQSQAIRRKEDLAACQVIGAIPFHLHIPDCIYRRNPKTDQPLITTNEELFQPLPAVEYPLAHRLAKQLANHIPSTSRIVCPLTLGRHVDHHLTRSAAERLGRTLWYYADYPYLLQEAGKLHEYISPEWQHYETSISLSGCRAWQDAIACYQSQISTFWSGIDEMRNAISHYWQKGGGSTLWAAPSS